MKKIDISDLTEIKEHKKKLKEDNKTRTKLERHSLTEIKKVEASAPQVNDTAPKVERVSLKEAIKEESPQFNKIKAKRKKKKKISTPKPEVRVIEIQKAQFKRGFIKSYIGKFLSYTTVLCVFEAANYIVQSYELKGRFNFGEFHSMFIFPDINYTYIFIAVSILFVSLITPKKSIQITEHGIACSNSSIVNYFFLTVNDTFVKWDQITKAKFKFNLFEPYLIFYDKDGMQIGYINFNITKRKLFFDKVQSFTSKDHPVVKVQKDVTLF